MKVVIIVEEIYSGNMYIF